jgi:hypothetical protein
LTTAAHSAGTVMPHSRFQLAAMALRSIVSTPPASASPEAIMAGCSVGSSTDILALTSPPVMDRHQAIVHTRRLPLRTTQRFDLDIGRHIWTLAAIRTQAGSGRACRETWDVRLSCWAYWESS